MPVRAIGSDNWSEADQGERQRTSHSKAFNRREKTNEELYAKSSATAPGAVALRSLAPCAQRRSSDATVAFLMPDQASTRYEQHDFPASRPRWKSSARLQGALPERRCRRARAAAAVQLGDLAGRQGRSCSTRSTSTAAASLVKLAQSQGIKVIAYDRPIPDAKADYYVSFDNEGIGKAIAEFAGRASEGDERRRRRAAACCRSTARRPMRPPA